LTVHVIHFNRPRSITMPNWCENRRGLHAENPESPTAAVEAVTKTDEKRRSGGVPAVGDAPEESQVAVTDLPLRGEATMRKVTNRGWTPIAYHTESGWRYGWRIEELGDESLVCRFPGEARNTRIPKREQRHVRHIHRGTLTTTPLRRNGEDV